MGSGRRWWAGIGVAVAAAAVVVWFAVGRRAPEPRRAGVPGFDRERASQGAHAATTPRGNALSEPEPPAAEGNDEASASGLDSDAIAAAWDTVDLDAVREAMPDNLYWKLSAPTKDTHVIEEREAERARWNVEYGKVLSGTATDEEIRAYFDERARLSGDYIEFTTYLLDHYEDTLPERDVGLLKLSRRLHQARLEEIPRKIEEAFERKRAQDAAREAWRKDQERFRDVEHPAAGE